MELYSLCHFFCYISSWQEGNRDPSCCTVNIMVTIWSIQQQLHGSGCGCPYGITLKSQGLHKRAMREERWSDETKTGTWTRGKESDFEVWMPWRRNSQLNYWRCCFTGDIGWGCPRPDSHTGTLPIWLPSLFSILSDPKTTARHFWFFIRTMHNNSQ